MQRMRTFLPFALEGKPDNSYNGGVYTGRDDVVE